MSKQNPSPRPQPSPTPRPNPDTPRGGGHMIDPGHTEIKPPKK